METLRLLIHIGTCGAIFRCIWSIFRFVMRRVQSVSLQNRLQKRRRGSYPWRIVHQFLLVSVVANAIYAYSPYAARIRGEHMIWGAVVMGLYFLGGLQTQSIIKVRQSLKHEFISHSFSQFDIRPERYLAMGGFVYFIACLFFPFMVDNWLINGLQKCITTVREIPFIGWLFKAIAFLSLFALFANGVYTTRRALKGESIFQRSIAGRLITHNRKRNKESH